MKQRIKVVIAPDSFKGSISARDAAEAIRRGLCEAAEGIVELCADCCPIADGGEGTLEALVEKKDCRALTVTGPSGAPVLA